MLGHEREAEFAREAEKRQLAVRAAGRKTAIHTRLRAGVRAGVIRFASRLLVVASAKGGADER